MITRFAPTFTRDHEAATSIPGDVVQSPAASYSPDTEGQAMTLSRRFLAIWFTLSLPLLLIAALTWRGPDPALAQQKFVWRVQSAWPATNLLHLSVVELAKMIEEMSGRRLKWEMSAAGTVVGTFEVLALAHDRKK